MNKLIVGSILSVLTVNSSFAAMSTSEQERHKAEMKKQGISTMQQLCV